MKKYKKRNKNKWIEEMGWFELKVVNEKWFKASCAKCIS